jgi:nucleotide-binding universal stress UspA family protein
MRYDRASREGGLMYKHVLLAYDGSPEGARALREGALLARQCGAEVFLLSVVPASMGTQIAEGVHGGVLAKQFADYEGFLQQAVERLRNYGFQPKARLVMGEPAPAIGKVAKEIAADLVVVGHRQQSFLSRWWSGSNQAVLSEHIRCSLLIARRDITMEEFDVEMLSFEQA